MTGKIRSIGAPILTAILILATSFAVISYGRGYRLDILKKSVSPTGLITATSDPMGATVFIDGKKHTATNANINVSPGWYTVTIAKEGYQSWEKRIRVQGEVVARADAMLFPANPSLYAVTANGAANPVPSPDGTKLAFIVPQTKESTASGQIINHEGIWVLDMTDKPLGLNRDARHVLTNEILPTDSALITWSPDSKQLLLTVTYGKADRYYLIDADKTNDMATPVASLDVLGQEWQQLSDAREKERTLGLKEDLIAIATASMSIVSFSPDETKILYEATRSATIPQIITPPLIGTNPTEEVRTMKPGNLYVYDLKEDRNYLLGTTALLFPDNTTLLSCETADKTGKPPNITIGIKPGLQQLLGNRCRRDTLSRNIQWLASSRHLVISGKDRIDVMEYDGTNRKTVYAAPFLGGFVTPWPNGSKIIILTKFNPGASATPNLYAVNIR